MTDTRDRTSSPLTAVHVTHEGIDHLGGIGTVLEGLLTSKVYQSAVNRSIFCGPLPFADRRVADPVQRLGEFGARCLYSGTDQFDPAGLGAILKPIEWSLGVKLVYGTRRFRQHAAGGLDGRTIECEVLLIDVSNPNLEKLAMFKWHLHEKHNIDSHRYEHGWDFEEWCRLALPAYHALSAILSQPLQTPTGPIVANLPAVVFCHEFMGVATGLRLAHDRARFRTLFHAHECSTARRIVENLPGHDVAFYPAMRAAAKRGEFIGDLFGDQSHYSRHALVSRTCDLDAVLAVGPETAEELRFLSPAMNAADVRVAYNGLPAPRVTIAEKSRSRDLVNRWLKAVTGTVPDYLFTHVTRPVPSKGLWRDAKVAAHIERLLAKEGKTAAYVLLTCGSNTRTFEQTTAMHREYGWPLNHREGFPDLDGPEVGIHRAMQQFVAAARGRMERAGSRATATLEEPALTPILLNQFGFTRERLGESAPEGISVDDLRRAADAEFGMSIYEPYGIAHLEALHAGAICIPSTVCGCLGLVRRGITQAGLTDETAPVVLPAEFTKEQITDPRAMTDQDRDALEEGICGRIAVELHKRLPRSAADRERLLAIGQKLAGFMSWDAVVASDILPVMREVAARA